MAILVARSLCCWVLLATIGLVVAQNAFAQPRDKCPQERADAENFYLEGEFDEAIRLLQACLVREELFVDEAVQVYRLIGLSGMNKGDMEQAQQAIRDLLQIVPTYEADPIQDPPSYQAMVTVVREEVAAEALAEAQQAPTEVEPMPSDSLQFVPDPDTTVTVEFPRVRFDPALPRRTVRTPKTWLLATGGAFVVISAVVMALGGGSDGGSSTQR